MKKKKKTSKKIHRFSHKKLFLFFLFAILGISLLATGHVYYQQNLAHFHDDSSLDGSEIAEAEQQTIPPDVQQKLDENRIATRNAESHVLGAKTRPTLSSVPIETIRIPILMYHYVEYVTDTNDTKRMSLNTTPATLESEIKTLQDAGYTFLTNKELTTILDRNTPLPPKPIVLTFDDGYRDFYSDAYPILKRYHAKATQYVISGFLDRPNHLLTSQLQTIAKEGLVEIGSHTIHHIWLKNNQLQTTRDEIAKSKEILEQLIQRPVVSFAYPFGAFDLQALEEVKHAGFESAVSTIPGITQTQENRYFLYRLRPGGRTGQNLLTWLDEQTS